MISSYINDRMLNSMFKSHSFLKTGTIISRLDSNLLLHISHVHNHVIVDEISFQRHLLTDHLQFHLQIHLQMTSGISSHPKPMPLTATDSFLRKKYLQSLSDRRHSETCGLHVHLSWNTVVQTH